VVVSAVIAYASARAIPEIDPVAGVVVRGTTVVVVMAAGLWLGGFLKPEELQMVERLWRARAMPAMPATPPPDTTELAGEIVAVDVTEPPEAAR
jgi:hypothetical protein